MAHDHDAPHHPAATSPAPGPEQPGRTRARVIRRTIELVLFVVFIAAFVATARGAWQRVTAREILPPAWAVLAAIALAALWLPAYQACFALTLRRALARAADAPDRVGPRSAAELFFRSHLARYVPGKVVQLGVLTDGLARRGLSLRLAARVVGAHQLGYVAATGVLGLPVGALLWISGARPQGLAVLGLGALASAAAATWTVKPGRLRAAASFIVNRAPGPGSISAPTVAPTRPAERAISLAAYAAVAAGQGVIVLPLVWTLTPGDRTPGPAALLAVCGSYPLARLIGQIGVVAPGGLGLREGAFALLAMPLTGGPAAAACAVWARLILMGAETAVYLTAAWVARRGRRRGLERPSLTPP